MGPPSPSFAAEAHLLLHGPGSVRIQPDTGLRRELRAQWAGSPRVRPRLSGSSLHARTNLTSESPYKRLPSDRGSRRRSTITKRQSIAAYSREQSFIG